MIQLLRQILGMTCCTEFTQWETKSFTRERAPTDKEWIRSNVEVVTERRRFQERHCTICGKIQQRRLKW